MKSSESIVNIASALAGFNGEVSRVAKDASNPFHKNKYATLDQIVDEVRPVLTKYGLSIMQIPSGDGQTISVTTLILHESGEWIESDPLTLVPVKNDPQQAGSAITYARRYSLSAFLSLNTGEDDDGNTASGKPSVDRDKLKQEALEKAEQAKKARENTVPSQGTNPEPVAEEVKAEVNPITEGQKLACQNMLKVLSRKHPDLNTENVLNEVLADFGVNTIDQLSTEQAKDVLAKITAKMKSK